jgi:hypothetical protein
LTRGLISSKLAKPTTTTGDKMAKTGRPSIDLNADELKQKEKARAQQWQASLKQRGLRRKSVLVTKESLETLANLKKIPALYAWTHSDIINAALESYSNSKFVQEMREDAEK